MSEGSPASCVSKSRKKASLGPICFQLSTVFVGSIESFKEIGLENELVKIQVLVIVVHV